MNKGQTKKKRANGEGSLFYNKSKKLWVAQYYINGQRKSKYARSKDEARKKMILNQSHAINGTYFEPSKMTVEQWLKLWLKEYMVGKRAPKTAENHENNIRNHIVPIIGKTKLKDLKPYQVQQMYNTVGQRLSSRSVRLVHLTLHGALKQAIFNDLILENVTEKCTLPKYRAKESRALTTDEQREFVEKIKNHPFELAYLFCLYAGLRRGEALALKWSDIDLEKMELHINKTVSRVKKMAKDDSTRKSEIIIKSPKTSTSRRFVPIAKELLPKIKSHRLRAQERKLAMGSDYNKEDYIFVDLKGNPYDGSYLNILFQRIGKDIFTKPATVHTLRHTFITRGAEANIPLKVMQKLVGHSKISITADIYTHISDAYITKEFEKMQFVL